MHKTTNTNGVIGLIVCDDLFNELKDQQRLSTIINHVRIKHRDINVQPVFLTMLNDRHTQIVGSIPRMFGESITIVRDHAATINALVLCTFGQPCVSLKILVDGKNTGARYKMLCPAGLHNHIYKDIDHPELVILYGEYSAGNIDLNDIKRRTGFEKRYITSAFMLWDQQSIKNPAT